MHEGKGVLDLIDLSSHSFKLWLLCLCPEILFTQLILKTEWIISASFLLVSFVCVVFLLLRRSVISAVYRQTAHSREDERHAEPDLSSWKVRKRRGWDYDGTGRAKENISQKMIRSLRLTTNNNWMGVVWWGQEKGSEEESVCCGF